MVNATRTRLLIWDWNGTLLDDTQFCYGIANRMRVERGMPPLEGVDAYRRVFRFPIIDYYRAMGYTFETESYDDVSVAFHRLYEQGVGGCPLTPGAKETLLAVRARGVEQILLSVTSQRRLEREAALKGVADCFSEILGQGDDLGAGKADMARRLLASRGLPPESVLFVGDTHHDAEIAASLGCRAALLTSGHQTREMLAGCGAVLIDALAEVPALL